MSANRTKYIFGLVLAFFMVISNPAVFAQETPHEAEPAQENHVVKEEKLDPAKIIMDHMALTSGKPFDETFKDFDKLLPIAKRPNVAVKCSAPSGSVSPSCSK